VLTAITELERESGIVGGELSEVRELTAQVRGPEAVATRVPEATASGDDAPAPRAAPAAQIGDVDGALYAGDTRPEHHFAPPVASGTPAGGVEPQSAGATATARRRSRRGRGWPKRRSACPRSTRRPETPPSVRPGRRRRRSSARSAER
jgi:hypothetical protein